MSAPDAQESSGDLLCTVVIPVYNGERVIGRCLNALAAQSVALCRFEIIVVDDGSRDGTPRLLADWAAAHPELRMRIVRQSNTGPAGARNLGARLAASPLLLFTDADCIPAPGWVAALLAAFAGPHPPAAAMGRYRSLQTTPAARFSQMEFEERYALMSASPTIDFVATYSAAYRREIFLAAGGFDTSFPKANNEDVEFSYRLSAQGQRMHFVPDAIVQHEHDATWGRYLRTKRGRGYWRMVVYRRYPEKAVRDSYTPQLLKLQLPLAILAAVGLLAGPMLRRPRPLVLAVPFLASTLPMARFVWRREPVTALWVPWGAWLRALAFVAGISQALLGGALRTTERPIQRAESLERTQAP